MNPATKDNKIHCVAMFTVIVAIKFKHNAFKNFIEEWGTKIFSKKILNPSLLRL